MTRKGAPLLAPDYHIHTRFSCDSQAQMTEMCRAAVSMGLQEIGFSEHFDLHPNDPCREFFQADDWWQELEHCREEFRSNLILRAGIELSEPHTHQDRVNEILSQYPWDYVLGALHYVDDDLIFDAEYFERSQDCAYNDYFGELVHMVQDGAFDVLAHMDIVKRYGSEHYGPYDPMHWEAPIRQVLAALAQNGKGLEINTITLRRPIGELTPDLLILRWFHELGGQWVTLGSDAHKPEYVGYAFDKALRTLRKAGFEAPAQYRLRRPALWKDPECL